MSTQHIWKSIINIIYKIKCDLGTAHWLPTLAVKHYTKLPLSIIQIKCIGFFKKMFDKYTVIVPSFSSKRGHVTEKHVLTGRKHDMLGNQTFEVRRPLSKLSHQSWKAFDVFDK